MQVTEPAEEGRPEYHRRTFEGVSGEGGGGDFLGFKGEAGPQKVLVLQPQT